MPQTDPTSDHSEDVVIFAQGDTCCAAYAPRETRKTFVETEVARLEACGSALVWRVPPGPIASGPNPRPCPYHAGRLHWLLVRELRR